MSPLSVLLTVVSACLAVAVLVLVILLRREYALRNKNSIHTEEPEHQPDPKHGDGVQEILERMSEGVLLLDGKLAPVFANRTARSLLGLDDRAFTLQMTSEEIISIGRAALDSSVEAEGTVSMWYPKRGNLRIRATPLEEQGGVIVVIQDITEELRSQRVRREFVAHASHELKSPVASLQTLAEAVRQAAIDDPTTAQRFSERLVMEAERLGRLVSDLLDLSRLEDPDNVASEMVDLSQLILGEVDETREEADAKGLELSAHVAPDIRVIGDGQQLALIFRNLLDNAVRYTPPEGHVALDVRREEDEVVVRVIDTGIGIPHEARERVFERFYRVDRARSRARGGTGLGLAIVKHAVELHGGSIGLESELERGSTFTVRLPAAGSHRSHIHSVAG
jgi:signal transduction histidine kinase